MKLEGIEGSLVLIKQGAEARVFESNFVGRRSVVKERFSKKYRHPLLDSKLTLKRLNAEARCLTKARKLGVSTPALYAVDPLLHTLTFEYVEGPAVKDVLLEFGLHGIVEERLDDIATQIGDAIGKLHDGGLIHGDLTTSNMLVHNEDKAVDLYVLERALLSMHSSCGNVVSSRPEKVLLDIWLFYIVLYERKCLLMLPISIPLSLLDGPYPCCIQEILEAVVCNIEQASSSTTKRKKTHNDRMSSSPFSRPGYVKVLCDFGVQ
ncbi:hypothetical protein SASPL_113584 [Salvia splendens]|uniref:non-specific serine/threonine protein kinase n=1 Tax=Salvia splendens TaxID=180675 RepID=A0A8X8Y4V6_SALSN|nr:hypothetical protein SASPL_113584 [Salvia splendens]